MSGLVLPGSQKPNGLSLPGKAGGAESAGADGKAKESQHNEANAVIPGVMGIVPTLQ